MMIFLHVNRFCRLSDCFIFYYGNLIFQKNEYDDIIFAVVRREIVGNNDGWLNANVNTYQTNYNPGKNNQIFHVT